MTRHTPIAAVHAPERSQQAPKGEALANHSRIARVSGEYFDADQIGWSCDECGRDEYSCDCDAFSAARNDRLADVGSSEMTRILDRASKLFIALMVVPAVWVWVAMPVRANAYGTALSSYGSRPSVAPVPASIAFAGDSK